MVEELEEVPQQAVFALVPLGAKGECTKNSALSGPSL